VRVLALLIAAFLVNLPVVHEAWTGHRIDVHGREVVGTVRATHVYRGDRFVDFRLPVAVDPSRATFSARLSPAAYDAARRTGEVEVRVVPGDPAANRVAGEVQSHLFAVIAVLGDAILLLVAVALWRRRRRWAGRVQAVDGDLVTFTLGPMTLTAQVEGLGRLAVGDRVPGRLEVVAGSDIDTGVPVGMLEQRFGASYDVRGRVLDVRRGRLRLALDNGYVLAVRVGPFRCRADLRDHAELVGTLVLTSR
jgi:hypothetical protein